MAKTLHDLIDAAKSGDIPLIDRCRAAGVDVNAQDMNKCTVLMYATMNNKVDAVIRLLECGAKVGITDGNGRTALAAAREWGRPSITPLLEEAYLLEKSQGWSLFSPSKLVHVEGSFTHCRKLTEIFNFESRERLIIVENLKTSAETTLPLTSFDDLPEQLREKIFQQFTRLGGVADEKFVLQGRLGFGGKSSGPLQPGGK